VERVVLRNGDGVEKSEFETGQSLSIELYYQTSRRIELPYFWIGVSSKHGGHFGANMLLDGFRPDYIEGRGSITCTFKTLPLLPQIYSVSAGIRDHDGASMLIRSRQFAIFRVVGKTGLNSDVAESMAKDTAPILVPYEWKLPDGQIRVVNSTSFEP